MTPRPTATAPAFVFTSESLSTDYRIHVSAPDAALLPGPWPAVVVFDGDYFFDVAAAAACELHAAGTIPPLLVAGIGYGKPFGSPGNRRGRDYTPTATSEEPHSGGAPAFLHELTNHLWPELMQRYPIDPNRSILAGHSLSALFVLYAMFQPRSFFRRAIIGAPSIWWDNRSLLTHIAQMRESQAALPSELYIGVGEDETPSMRGDLTLFHEQLGARPFDELAITTEVFPKRDHYNVLPDLFRGGFRFLFRREQATASDER